MQKTAPSPSTTRAGLVLVPKVDKNGRQTRVWVRKDDLSGAQLSRVVFRPSTVASNRLYSAGFDSREIKTSPWGKVNKVEEIHAGIYSVDADEGKGVFLSPARQDEIDEAWKLGEGDGWYSADGMEWSVIPYTFPEEFGEEASEQAAENLRDYYPHEYTEVTGEIVYEEESYVLSAEAFDQAHEGEYAATSMEDGVNEDEVIITASRIGEEGDDAEFIVSKEELKDDGELPKGHRKLIDEEKHPRTNPEIEALKRELKDAIKGALIAKFPRSKYVISTYYVTKATMQGINKKRSADDEDEYISKDWGLRGMQKGFMSQLIVELKNHSQPRTADEEYARQMRKYRRQQRNRRWMQRIIG
jgi:hypothetical protein